MQASNVVVAINRELKLIFNVVKLTFDAGHKVHCEERVVSLYFILLDFIVCDD